MQLTPLQIKAIQIYLQEAGLHNDALRTELLDHLCCQLETAMQTGLSFEAAKAKVWSAYTPQQLLKTEKQVQSAVQKPNVMQKILLIAALLGSVFLSTYLLYPIQEEEAVAEMSIETEAKASMVSFSYPPLPPKASPLPIDYSVTSSYGLRVHPIYKVRRRHSGADLKAPLGTPVMAAGDGIVRFARDSSAWGLIIIIEHDSIFTSQYAHLHSIDIKEGAFVYAGEQIGTVGSTGKSSGPHLHYEIHEHGVAVDPEIYLPKP